MKPYGVSLSLGPFHLLQLHVIKSSNDIMTDKQMGLYTDKYYTYLEGMIAQAIGNFTKPGSTSIFKQKVSGFSEV